jgi:hypothetical protein
MRIRAPEHCPEGRPRDLCIEHVRIDVRAVRPVDGAEVLAHLNLLKQHTLTERREHALERYEVRNDYPPCVPSSNRRNRRYPSIALASTTPFNMASLRWSNLLQSGVLPCTLSVLAQLPLMQRRPFHDEAQYARRKPLL